MDRERELLQTLQDGTALRQHLASWPVLGLHVETAHADEFAQLWGQLQPLMADLQEYADSTKIGEGPYLTLANEVSAKIGEQAAVLRQGKVNEVLQSILDARQDQNNRLIAAALAAERAQVAENAAPQVPMAQAEAPDPWVIGAEPESEPEPAQARPEVEQILALAQRYGDEVRRLTQVLEQLRLQAEQTPASSYIDRAVVEDITRSLQMAQDAQQRLHEQAALAQARGVPGRGQPEAAQAEGGAQHVRDFIQALLGPQSGLTPAQVVGVLTQRGDEPGFSPLRQAAGMPQREGHAEGSGQAPEDVFERAQQIAAAESRGGIAMSGGGAGSARQLRAPRQVANAVPPNVAPHQQIVALDPFEGRQEPGLPGLNVALSRGHADGVRQLMQQIPQLGGATGMVHRDAPGVVPDPAAAADAVQMHVQHQPFMTHQRRDLPDSHEATEQRTQHENQGVAPAKNR
jgi:hypothetical protein